MRHILLIYTLSFLIFSVFLEQTLAQNNSSPPDLVRIALMPFCDETVTPKIQERPDNRRMYNRTFGSIRSIQGCEKQATWISKSRTNQTITNFSDETDPATAFCKNYITDSICTAFDTDILILGEFIVNPDSSVEVYYSVENCEGLYTHGYQYLTEQPIQGHLNNLNSLYVKVAQVVKKDLANFLECKTVIDTASVFREAMTLYARGDMQMSNFIRAIELFQQILTQYPNHQQAQYYQGLSHFALNEYEAAKLCFASLNDYESADIYLKHCDVQTKPSIWYNTPQRRVEWWNQLHPNWKIGFNQFLTNAVEATPTDAQLEQLFSSNEIKIEYVDLPDLSGLAALTQLKVLSCYKTRLENLQGIEHLQNLSQLSINSNKITSLEPIRALPHLTRLYCRDNPLENLIGIEDKDKKSFIIFCGRSVLNKEIKRIKNLGFNIQL